MSGKYPILVENFGGKARSDTAICEGCHHEFTWDPMEGDPYDLCARCKECGEQIVWKYDTAPKCPGCGNLGYEADKVGGACSRRCQLQAEYANHLRERGAA